MSKYEGPLESPKTPEIVKRAYSLWKGQVSRCSQPKNNRYKWYGEKGISVEYGSRDFVNWFITETNSKQLDYKKYGTSRIDHSKNYCFSNIKLETKSDNCKERIRRLGNPTEAVKKKVVVIDNKTGRELFVAESVIDAARKTGVCIQTVSNTCNKRFKSNYKKYTFLFLGE